MQSKKYRKSLQKSIALAAITSFLAMPVNMAAFANNNITAGNSGIGSMTDITNGQGNVTDITGGFIHNGTGFTHFDQFQVGQGGTANLNFGAGADRYVNMVNSQINIQGTFNALKNGGLGNVIFISPEGMVVGAGGIMNVGSLQTIIPTLGDYNNLISKFGSAFNSSDLTELLGREVDKDSPLTADDLQKISQKYNIKMDDLTDALGKLKAGGEGVISIAGQILATGDVDLKSGNGIYFRDNGIINTNTVGNTIGDISLFTNTGDIVGSNVLNLDSSGNITLSAKNGGIGSGIVENPELYGEPKTVGSLNVKVAEGKKLNVEVSDTTGSTGSYKGYASVANNTTNLQVGSVKGSNVKIVNNGAGTLKTTEAISGVDKLYLKAANGDLLVKKDITTNEIIRLAADNSVEAQGNLKVNGNGYISVYADKGSIDMNDASIKMGNIDIKANGAPDAIFTDNGSVTHGNLTIEERGDAEGYLRLTDDQKLSTGIKAPDTFRFDGIHITSTNGNIVQKSGTKINSAGRVDLTAGKSVNNTVQAKDLITVQAGKTADLNTIGTARLGDVIASTIKVNGENILVDGMVKGGTVNVNATDRLTVRPNTALDANHRTYGKIEASGNVDINAKNGISASEHSVSGPAISSTGGNVTLTTDGNIYTQDSKDNRLSVGAAGKVDASGKNVNIKLTDINGNVGVINAAKDVNLGAAGDVNILDKVVGANNVIITADGHIHQVAGGSRPSIVSGNNMSLISNKSDVGDPNNYLQIKVGGQLDAAAPNGGVYIASDDNLVVNQVSAGKDVGIETGGYLHQTDNGKRPAIISGGDMHLVSKNDNVGDPNNYLTVKVGDKLDAHAPNGGVYIYGYGDLVTDRIEAGKDVVIGGNKDIIIPHDKEDGNIIAGGDVTITAGDNVLNGGGDNVGIVAPNGDITIIANTNQSDKPGHIGELPYQDLNNSINVTLGGEVNKDEIGVPTEDKILNVHIMGSGNGGDVTPGGDGTGNDDGFNMDDRDQRNMKFVSDDKDDASGRGHRQDLRYNVANSEYVLLNSDADSNAKVVDVLNISKQGMLVQTTETPKVGETMKISMDYKGLPFTVEGQVVRIDPAKNTAGIKFNNIDQLTSSMILYLGMMNGK